MKGECEVKGLCAHDRLEHLLEDFPEMDVRAKNLIRKALERLHEEERKVLNLVEDALRLFP